MQQVIRVLLCGMLGGMLIAGCRTASRVIEVPRVDLEVSGGNRGYLIGTPPTISENQSSTRAMAEMEFEIPSFSRPGSRPVRPVSLGEVAPPETDLSESGATPAGTSPQVYDTYVVHKGDTLWSIAANPQVFGDASRWRLLFEANRDLLKSPDRLRPGMTLKIPRGSSPSQSNEAQDRGFTK